VREIGLLIYIIALLIIAGHTALKMQEVRQIVEFIIQEQSTVVLLDF